MNNSKPINCKDETAENTIQRIRGMLHDIDIMPIEAEWYNPVKDYYSLNLKIANTNIFSKESTVRMAN